MSSITELWPFLPSKTHWGNHKALKLRLKTLSLWKISVLNVLSQRMCWWTEVVILFRPQNTSENVCSTRFTICQYLLQCKFMPFSFKRPCMTGHWKTSAKYCYPKYIFSLTAAICHLYLSSVSGIIYTVWHVENSRCLWLCSKARWMALWSEDITSFYLIEELLQ